MKLNTFLLLMAVILSPVLSGCDSSEPDDDHAGEEELITRVILTLDSSGGTVVASAEDPDGDGSGFQITPIALSAGVTYEGTVELLDDPNDEDITAEVLAEADEHQFFYTLSSSLSNVASLEITDQDGNGLPLGLAFTIESTGPGTGTLNVVLSHYDDQPKNGTDRSDETDLNVTFPVTFN